ncbi:MAG: stage II sporulation protein R [Firmicutes bacterium]|nr:stage II sporulation protein R [Bacillota bacterium]
MKKYIIIGLSAFLLFQTLGRDAKTVMIPEDAIRFRVVANSDSKEDQALKMKVSEAVQGDLYTMLSNTKGSDEARKTIQSSLPDLRLKVANTLKEEQSTLPFELNYGMNYFPKKVYKGVTYKEGEYESLLITLGKGEGKNWWCVLFPPLCIMEAEETEAKEETEYKFFIQELIEKYL